MKIEWILIFSGLLIILADVLLGAAHTASRQGLFESNKARVERVLQALIASEARYGQVTVRVEAALGGILVHGSGTVPDVNDQFDFHRDVFLKTGEASLKVDGFFNGIHALNAPIFPPGLSPNQPHSLIKKDDGTWEIKAIEPFPLRGR